MASVKAAPDPTTPTEMPEVKFVKPTMAPDQNTLYALILISSYFSSLSHYQFFGLFRRRIPEITP